MFKHCVIRHVADKLNSLDIKIFDEVRARITNSDVILECQCEFREVFADHACAYDEKMLPRAVDVDELLI